MITLYLLCLLLSLSRSVAGHASLWHPSMWGFNVTQQTFPYDNRPVAPLMAMNFSQWWFHGHLAYPPHPTDIFALPAGQRATAEIACNKGATSYFASSEGGDVRAGNDVCPGSPTSEYHTTGLSDVKGCGLAIAYKSDVASVQPADFTVFSVNQTCVWTRFTEFAVPARMPPCPDGKCTCAFFWIHSQDSGGEQNYMNGFQCNITGATSTVALAKPQVPRRCGADPANKKPAAVPGNCTYGAKQPFYWFQLEQNNMFEGTYAPPFYTDLYNFKDGAQDDIFADSYASMPVPGPNQTVLPVLAVPPPPGSSSASAGGSATSVSGGTTTSSATTASHTTHTTATTSSSASTSTHTQNSPSPSQRTCSRSSNSGASAFSRRSRNAFSRRSLNAFSRRSTLSRRIASSGRNASSGQPDSEPESPPSLAGRILAMTRHSRALDVRRRGSLWRPL
ncbi:hypothetical protein BJ138DRAFT_950191 [Hygrophoropsis aurantiaca]|uniref:Uncharacterized protein n=1 Tax=Hygrophoropsis aurantiaca TaxID=72124 RepID=A0ACB7ZU22_9AGAM|nr:hypothetical protein BJ138DRAFT_950191 [Hygrophoropsis aurantiaca]